MFKNLRASDYLNRCHRNIDVNVSLINEDEDILIVCMFEIYDNIAKPCDVLKYLIYISEHIWICLNIFSLFMRLLDVVTFFSPVAQFQSFGLKLWFIAYIFKQTGLWICDMIKESKSTSHFDLFWIAFFLTKILQVVPNQALWTSQNDIIAL